jgi:hypothetical protein
MISATDLSLKDPKMPRELITTSASRPGSSFLLIQAAKVRATATDSAALINTKALVKMDNEIMKQIMDKHQPMMKQMMTDRKDIMQMMMQAPWICRGWMIHR